MSGFRKRSEAPTGNAFAVASDDTEWLKFTGQCNLGALYAFSRSSTKAKSYKLCSIASNVTSLKPFFQEKIVISRETAIINQQRVVKADFSGRLQHRSIS